MWEVTRSLAAHATKIDPSEEGDHGSAGGGGSEESSSFKQQIEIPLAVSLVFRYFVLGDRCMSLGQWYAVMLFISSLCTTAVTTSCAFDYLSGSVEAAAVAKADPAWRRPCEDVRSRASGVALAPPFSIGVSHPPYSQRAKQQQKYDEKIMFGSLKLVPGRYQVMMS